MRFSLGLAASVALACTLTACGGGSPEPPALDTPAPTQSVSTPTPTPSATASAKPTAAPTPTDVVETGGGGKVDAATKAAAEAFVQNVLTALDKATTTGDFKDAQAVFDKSCTTCKDGIAYIQGIYAKNQKIVGGEYQDPRFSVVDSPVADVVVRVDSTVAAYKVVNAAGKTIGRAGAEPDISNFHLKKSGDTWHVVRWSYS
ncbi:DUF6318 family protein [Tenggerimyces flavus]|uniref:DUF6318 family protein n=1 Tax=Tenggerimyces flavus TaxID=1708749 RepID=A0ABV7YLI2_9ACTN|nr:DUF6318 family protein [Tenggerimyces flavus]MBM7785809.1 hypothetical protein [Tenggerimyces flavus]